ncbi:BamA/OMP85 family outer membrane protein [Actomonas aquatica]|uniref:BamA/TamA family outer membrane protein n=1 Tax=Actomonas aquatica TaxID=2866162 RepID=A0ABZ1C7L5_9BACT|nr:BamA/TamA family outer membrane protein [Opitutus sp. WL0086]WRQ87702.1 BamA/TamA family outer membrane protein [Opitutus sp. WL0086]
MSAWWRRGLGALIALGALGVGRVVAEPELNVSGAGWLESNKIERSVRSLSQVETRSTLDANAIEDAVFFTLSAVAANGYLRAEVDATIERPSGEVLKHHFDYRFAELLPRPLEAVRLDLEVIQGVRYHFGEVTTEGGEAVLSSERAHELLVPSGGLLNLRSDRMFTPARLRQGLDQIEVWLAARGYADARARAVSEERNHETGEVTVRVEIAPGRQWYVTSVDTDAAPAGVDVPDLPVAADQIWTSGWQQDEVEKVRQAYFEAGYVDVRLRAEREGEVADDGTMGAAVHIGVEPGTQVIAAPVQFAGDVVVADSVLRRRVEVTAGEPLNPSDVEATRRRLGRLRALAGVDVRYESAADGQRSPVFVLEEREPWESSLLLGYGSYEQVRGGVELRGFNLLRRSHQLRLEAVGSLKSLRGDMVYTVPDLFGETVDAKLRLFGLDREELSFQRQEYGAVASVTRRDLAWIKADFTAAYTYQDLRSRESELGTRAMDVVDTTSASLTLGLSHDGRDNPLVPHEGLRWFAQIEAADPVLGGESGFQRLEAGLSWHRPLGDTNWLHVGLTHGTVLTLGQDSDRWLPANKRFFPGGENSLRGMTTGEASPRNGAGEFVGAKSFTLLNVEFEQALTRRISAVLFYDALGETARIQDGLWDVQLHSVGLGLRYQTLIGPVRLEYGHNLTPRPLDPDGTLHFSIGFPF